MTTVGILSGDVADQTPAVDDEERAVDVLGIGFGPANLSLAIAIEERNAVLAPDRRTTACFVESKDGFGWHDGMLLPGSTMQISFLKDLVSQRSPASTYSFLNYLHQRHRLTDFINLKTFFPTRREFHDYLSWAAERVSAPVRYGTTAARIEWSGSVFEVDVATAGGARETIRARDIVVGTGIRPVLPTGIAPGPRVFHNHRLLERLSGLRVRRRARFVVVGAGQSAAEVAAYLHDRYPEAEVHASLRKFGYMPADDTPYANRIFDPESVDEFFTAPAHLRRVLLDHHRLTNYGAVDAELIEDLYRREYRERTEGTRRLFIHRVTEVSSIEEGEHGAVVALRDIGGRGETLVDADAVVFATGFRPWSVRELLGTSIPADEAYDTAEPIVSRDYRLKLDGIPGRIFLNGGVEHSHGLTSSLLSNLAPRATEILRAVLEGDRVPVR
ncbi:MAG: lysine N(6)-hydroxylase/L-ornithine N(5)-oxygenase family protein [Candidatus Microbacterium stercoravium]